MTTERLDESLMRDNLKDLFQGYLYNCQTFSERCMVEKIYSDVFEQINESYR